jgi:hypothetical protein
MLHPVLETVFSTFDQADIAWCLLRFPSNLGAPSGGDVDLLIDRRNIGIVQKVLKKLGFAARGHSIHPHFLTYHRFTDSWIWLDIATELSFGRNYALRTRAEAGCLARRQRNGVFNVPAPDDAFWVLLLHCMLDKRAIALRHRARLQELARSARTNGPLGQFLETICPVGWFPGRMLECVSRGDWIALERFAPSLTAAWMRQGSIPSYRMRVHRALRLIGKPLTAWRHRGLSVSLLGPDGAGKSTLAIGIQNSFICPVRLVYMGLTGGLLPRADSLRFPVFVAFSRLLIFWCRYLVAQYHRFRGRLVVFDRYIYDAEVPTPYPLSRLKRTYRWLDGHALPAPDLVLVLSAPGEVMYERKGSYNPKQLEDWRQHFLALRYRIPQLQIIDATRTKDEVRADVVERIWQRYAVRWGNELVSNR